MSVSPLTQRSHFISFRRAQGVSTCQMGLGRGGWEGLGVHEHLVGVNMGPGVVVEHRESLAASH